MTITKMYIYRFKSLFYLWHKENDSIANEHMNRQVTSSVQIHGGDTKLKHNVIQWYIL